jgi:succinoglycan biosynthesis transport protein ExoP
VSPGGRAAASATLAGARTQLYQTLESGAATLKPDASADARRSLAAYVFADIDATTQRDAADGLKHSIDALTNSARSQPASNIELTRLQNEVDRNRQLLQSFQAQMIASDISQAVETTDLGLRIEIVDPAQLPLEPSWPNRKKILILAALMGPVLGIGFALLTEMLDPTLRSLEDIQRVAPEPVLGTLPLLNEAMTRPSGLRRYWIPVTLTGIVILTVAFFTMRATIFPGLGTTGTHVQAVEPTEGLAQ